MFLHLSVILFTEGVCQTPPWADTPGQIPPWQTPPLGRHPPADTPPLHSACWDRTLTEHLPLIAVMLEVKTKISDKSR